MQQRQRQSDQQQSQQPSNVKTHPGDEAPPGTPGTGENICPVCSGKGTISGKTCDNCEGTGKVITGIGGA